jgi:enamine deaminase RidA (YjgF/YER057c/UK114 family)
MNKREIDNAKLPSLGFPWALHLADVKEWLFISGVPAMDTGGKVIGDTIEEQFRFIVARIEEIAGRSGMTLGDIVFLTITVTEKVNLYEKWGELLKEYVGSFPNAPGPAGGTLRIVKGLSHPKMLIEVEAIAAR